jgi:hypothetical protein
LISSIYWLMSCSDCSDMVRVWKKRSKKNGKVSREGGVKVGGKRETGIHRCLRIKGYLQNGTIKIK